MRAGTVAIGDREWSVSIASTSSELEAGLGGAESLAPGTGMLFDLGSAGAVRVTTEPMLFDIDIIFINSELQVVSVAHDVAPGYLVTEETPCHYFLEVNAGEAAGIEAGDYVEINILAEPASGLSQWLPAVTAVAALGFVGTVMGGMMRSMFGSSTGNPAKSGASRKRYSRPYLTNWQYGGYSYVEEDPAKPERLWTRGMADYVRPEEVIAIAEKEDLDISLAGEFWERIGYRGWGEKISTSEAKRALRKAREHVAAPRSGNVSVTCPICGEVLQVPHWDRVSRTDVLARHLEERHRHGTGEAPPVQETKVPGGRR